MEGGPALSLIAGWPDETVHFFDWEKDQYVLLPDDHDVEALVSGGIIAPVPAGTGVPGDHSYYKVLVPKTTPPLPALGLVVGWPDEPVHYFDWKKGQTVVLPDIHEVEALVSGGWLEPIQIASVE
jgi:hypothetical protein